ncbi:MAG TPA: 3-deoxy-D-manno-octulosonic acid transferase [Planctomycetaceae bacterium]|nr:3-deoxy-D-manno-octulosonic acid transferase [Planctomycetaceae bacterium]
MQHRPPRVIAWFLNAAYAALLVVLAPVLTWRIAVQRKYRTGWSEKLLGRLPQPGEAQSTKHKAPTHPSPLTTHPPRLWLHAVSVGEVLQLQQIVRRIREQRPDVEFVISTTTVTGHAVAREKFPDDTVCYFPLDFSWAVRRAIRRVRPAAIVLVELELWPNFILAAKAAGVPLVLVNGRISEQSFRGYRRIRFLMRRLLGCFETLAVQNETYGRRLVELGARSDNVVITGSIKFDGVETGRNNAKTLELRRAFGIADNERVFIAGSTQEPEEGYALDTWLALRPEFPDLRLILVPRHKERFEAVARLVESRGLALVRRSAGRGSRVKGQGRESRESRVESVDPRPICLLDTLGELAACWGLADVAFVGGSLTTRGGQNMIEPAAYGAAVLFGPDTRNFRDVVELLLSHGAARVVQDAGDLTRTVRELLTDSQAASRQGQIAQQLVLAQQGATAKTVSLVLDSIEPADKVSGSGERLRFAA